jgi:hypothetical protein
MLQLSAPVQGLQLLTRQQQNLSAMELIESMIGMEIIDGEIARNLKVIVGNFFCSYSIVSVLDDPTY